MSDEALELTAYFGERDRVDGRFLSDALLDRVAAAGVRTSVLLRGVSGYGDKHLLRTDRLLTLSEDLPLAVIAVDAPERIRALAAEAAALMDGGLLSLEPARFVRGAAEVDGGAKLTVSVGRRQRIGAASAARTVVDVLHRHGVAGASVLLGVDGTAHGERRRASFVGRNADVPLTILAVGDGAPVAAAAAELATIVERPLMTLQGATMLKRDGVRLADPPAPGGDWVKLMVYASETSRSGAGPLHVALVEGLRRGGAHGATVLRGVWGYHGDHEPHGDRLLALRRRVPMVSAVLEAPDRAEEAWRVVDAVTETTGLVTWERVPEVRQLRP